MKLMKYAELYSYTFYFQSNINLILKCYGITGISIFIYHIIHKVIPLYLIANGITTNYKCYTI